MHISKNATKNKKFPNNRFYSLEMAFLVTTFVKLRLKDRAI